MKALYLDDKRPKQLSNQLVGHQYFGIIHGAFVDVTLNRKQHQKSLATLYTEKLELGVKLSKTMPECDVKLTLSGANFAKIPEPKHPESIILCVDSGKNKDLNHDQLKQITPQWVSQSKQPWVALLRETTTFSELKTEQSVTDRGPKDTILTKKNSNDSGEFRQLIRTQIYQAVAIKDALTPTLNRSNFATVVINGANTIGKNQSMKLNINQLKETYNQKISGRIQSTIQQKHEMKSQQSHLNRHHSHDLER